MMKVLTILKTKVYITLIINLGHELVDIGAEVFVVVTLEVVIELLVLLVSS